MTLFYPRLEGYYQKTEGVKAKIRNNGYHIVKRFVHERHAGPR